MTRKRDQKGNRKADGTPGPTCQFADSIHIRDEDDLEELLRLFHDRYGDDVLQRMFGVCSVPIHLEDLADCYQVGFTAFYRWLDRCRQKNQAIELQGETEADAWLRVSYRFFRYPVIRWAKKRGRLSEQTHGSGPDDRLPAAEGVTELTPELEATRAESAKRNEALPELIRHAIHVALTVDEAEVFLTYYVHAREFDRRSIFGPLAKHMERDLERKLSPRDVHRLWKSGRPKLKAFLTNQGGPLLRDFIGESSHAEKHSPPEAGSPAGGE